MTKEEILKLHELSECDQYESLIASGILICYRPKDNIRFGGEYECLEAAAFRLRDEAVKYYNNNPPKGCPYAYYDWGVSINRICAFLNWPNGRWKGYAKPIHWIQAALLAKLDN